MLTFCLCTSEERRLDKKIEKGKFSLEAFFRYNQLQGLTVKANIFKV